MSLIRYLLLTLLVLSLEPSYGQQDVDFHLITHYFSGKKILKVYQNVASPYVWVLALNNEVYRLNMTTQVIDDLSNQFIPLKQYQFIDIASPDDQKLFVATNSTEVALLFNGAIKLIGTAKGLIGNVNSISLFLTNSCYYYGNPNLLRIGTDKGWANYDISNDVLSFYPDNQSGNIFEQNFRVGIFANSAGHDAIDPDAIPIDVYTSSLVNSLTVAGGYIWRNGIYGHPTTAFYSFPNLYFDYQMEDYLIYLYWGSENGLFENRLVQSNNQGEIKQFLKGIKVNKINNILGLTSFGGQIFKSNLLVGTEKGLYFSNSTAHTSTIPPDLFITHMDDLGNISVNDIQINVANVSQTYPLVDCEEGAWVGTDNGLYYIKPDYGKYNNLQNARLVHFKDQSNSVDLLNFCSQVTTSLLLNDDVASSNIQWYKDSKEIPEAISKELDINSPGDYYAVLYDPCSDIHIETNHLKVTLNASPVFTFNYPDELRYCKGTPVTLKAGGSAAYQYRWYKDGALTGDVTPSLIITQAGKYKVEVSSCDGSWVPSKEVQVALINIPVPVIVTDKPAYCIDDNATLSIAVPTDPNYTINWYKDNILLTADVNHTSVITNNPGVYTVTIVNNQSNSDGTICNQTFVSQPLSFNPPPTVSIQKIVKTTLCDGQTVDLKVTYTTGTVKWSTGETSDQIKVSNSGSYKATVTTAAGCSVDATTDVQFFPNPVLNIPNAGICVASHKTATLTAPPGLASYIWNGQTGSNTYTTDHPQTVTVIVTDANGCQATQQIQVNDECPDVKIPNAFTPNGDGINDTWDILGLEYDPTALVRVFTRYGQQVFQSKGYGTPWNGEAKGQKLPTGAYYYIITAKNGSQTYSGEVTIIH